MKYLLCFSIIVAFLICFCQNSDCEAKYYGNNCEEYIPNLVTTIVKWNITINYVYNTTSPSNLTSRITNFSCSSRFKNHEIFGEGSKCLYLYHPFFQDQIISIRVVVGTQTSIKTQLFTNVILHLLTSNDTLNIKVISDNYGATILSTVLTSLFFFCCFSVCFIGGIALVFKFVSNMIDITEEDKFIQELNDLVDGDVGDSVINEQGYLVRPISEVVTDSESESDSENEDDDYDDDDDENGGIDNVGRRSQLLKGRKKKKKIVKNTFQIGFKLKDDLSPEELVEKIDELDLEIDQYLNDEKKDFSKLIYTKLKNFEYIIGAFLEKHAEDEIGEELQMYLENPIKGFYRKVYEHSDYSNLIHENFEKFMKDVATRLVVSDQLVKRIKKERPVHLHIYMGKEINKQSLFIDDKFRLLENQVKEFNATLEEIRDDIPDENYIQNLMRKKLSSIIANHDGLVEKAMMGRQKLYCGMIFEETSSKSNDRQYLSYCGELRDGTPNGFGEEYNELNKMIFEGEFVDGVKVLKELDSASSDEAYD